MFKNLVLPQAAALSSVIILISGTAGVIMRKAYNAYCIKHSGCNEAKIIKRGYAFKFIVLILFSVAGLCLGNVINIILTFHTAITHGMTPNPDTGKYDIPYGETIMLNKYSVKETNVDISNLKNKAIIYVRYDCPDCVLLHNQLADIKDIIFLSSRTEKGKEVREMYNINLTEIPQGVYIDADGNSTTVRITQGSGDALTLDMHQITALQEMANQ